jgi:hypothetical protein
MAARTRKRWSQRVTQTSDALTLDRGVFSRNDPRSIARSLKRSAERSSRRKSGSYASAMSMLTFYINRAGRHLPASRKRKLMRAKQELRELYGRDEPVKTAGTRARPKSRSGARGSSSKRGAKRRSAPVRRGRTRAARKKR